MEMCMENNHSIWIYWMDFWSDFETVSGNAHDTIQSEVFKFIHKYHSNILVCTSSAAAADYESDFLAPVRVPFATLVRPRPYWTRYGPLDPSTATMWPFKKIKNYLQVFEIVIASGNYCSKFVEDIN